MKPQELKEKIRSGALSVYTDLYADIPAETARFLTALDKFAEAFGEDADLSVFSVPGRTEILGNHTDHNRGTVLAGAINRDIIAVAAPNDLGRVRFLSEGRELDDVDLSVADDKDAYPNYSSASLISGMAQGFLNAGYAVGGFDAYSVTEVATGSGLSSSAAYEVMIGNIFNHLYNDGSVSNVEIAKIAQFAENVYFGKPCGLMDQMACAVGGFVYMDFADPKNPVVEPIDFSLSAAGYGLAIVATGGNHADLNEDYASVPAEMKAVAQALGREVLRGVTEQELLAKIPALRGKISDRALLRALHYLRENPRVETAKAALKTGDLKTFLSCVTASGLSSFTYLQNVYTVKNVAEQGLSLALCVSDGFLSKVGGACRVHGGGFAGTIQSFVPNAELPAYVALLDGVMGEGCAMALSIRPKGAVKLF